MTDETPTPSENERRRAAVEFLSGRIDFERTLSMPSSEATLKLDRMRELLARLGNPQADLPIIHVAGTKGKGSTAALIAAMLSAAGYRTGLFTSPHIERVEERIAVDGRPCSADALADMVEQVRPAVEAMDRESPSSSLGPTYFEILTAMALCHFSKIGARAVVLEVGLGGRLDSTNVCTPIVSVITSISLDHTKQLGDTLGAIAAEKAGIIKPGVPVVSGVVESDVIEPRTEGPRAVIRRIARQNGCRLIERGDDFDFEYHPPRHLEQSPGPATFDYFSNAAEAANAAEDTAAGASTPAAKQSAKRLAGLPLVYGDLSLSLVGRHQAANAAVAVAVVEELRRQGWRIPDEAVRRGLIEIQWPARVEVASRRPAIVLDAAHNTASIAALVEVLEESFSVRQRLLIFATTREKDHRGMLRHLLGHFDRVLFTQYQNNPRGVPAEELMTLASECLDAGDVDFAKKKGDPPRSPTTLEVASTPAQAWRNALAAADADDLICATGSFFLISEIRQEWQLCRSGS